MSTVFGSRRAAPVAAVALGVLTLGCLLARLPLDDLATPVGVGGMLADWLATGAAAVAGVVVGTLVAARRPRNPIGWMLLAIFVLAGAPFGDYAIVDYRMHHGSLPAGWVAVVFGADWPIWLVLIAILLWLFPDGHLPARRGRRTAVILIVAGMLLGLAASANGIAAVAGHDIRIDASGTLTTEQAGAWSVLHGALALAAFGSLAAWLVLQVPRYRQSSGERRSQLKWLYSGATVFVVTVFCNAFASGSTSGVAWLFGDVISPVGFGTFVACIAVAVLRYRLYAIDRIISRVISYTIITAMLAGVFAGLVVLATDVLPVKTPVAVAASTLAVAALFNPLRQRVQRMVERRFNRARYDADKTVAAFAARLQDTVDLDSVRDDLASVVSQALEPAHLSVWINRPG